MMARCYVCSETTTTDERIVSEMHGTEFILCQTCMRALVCGTEQMRIARGRFGRDVE